MKKVFVILASLAILAGCEKAFYNDGESLTFTAEIVSEAITKTTLDTSTGVQSWENGDEITITDGTNTALYSVYSISDGYATFKKKSGGNLKAEGVTYSAFYGYDPTSAAPVPATSQEYSAAPGKYPMKATSQTTSLQFSPICGVLQITLKESGETIRNLAVIDSYGAIYTLHCTEAQSIDNAHTFCIALPEGTYNKYVFTNDSGKTCTKTAKAGNGTNIAVGRINYINFTSSLSFAADPYSKLTVLDPGKTRPEAPTIVTPQHPELVHEVSDTLFDYTLNDIWDDYKNLLTYCNKGEGTSDPVAIDGVIRFYQGKNSNDGGSYLTVKSNNGAKILEVEVGSSTNTTLAYSINGKIKKYNKQTVAAGSRYLAVPSEDCTQVNIYCMGTTKEERWYMDYIRVKYQGGFVDSDFETPDEEYGPLIQVPLPFTENFENGFPDAGDKVSYYKFGLTDTGRDNLQWSIWFGNFSWQNPIQGGKSAQMRTYQKEEDYDQSQLGSLKTEFFVKDLTEVDFDFYMSEYYIKAQISYCDFGSDTWKNATPVKLANYADRKTVQHFAYTLDGGAKHNAKIKIELTEDTGFPSKDHYDFLVDNVVFK